jgi:hypothetical protein
VAEKKPPTLKIVGARGRVALALPKPTLLGLGACAQQLESIPSLYSGLKPTLLGLGACAQQLESIPSLYSGLKPTLLGLGACAQQLESIPSLYSGLTVHVPVSSEETAYHVNTRLGCADGRHLRRDGLGFRIWGSFGVEGLHGRQLPRDGLGFRI